ncbi:Glutamate 5-kinase [Streptomyces canarius]
MAEQRPSGREPAVTGARRVVVKVGSSSLTTASGGLDADRVDALVDVLAKVRDGGEREVVLVSSGAIAAGLAPLGLVRRPKDLARQQAAASVGQGLLVARYTASFARYGVRVGQVLLTADDTSRRGHYRNAYSTLDKLLEMGAVPVVNENDTVGRRRDPLRRQRPARRPRRPPRPRRPARPALRRGRPLRRTARHPRRRPDRRGHRPRRPDRRHHRQRRQGRRRHRRHGHQGRGRPHRHRRRHPRRPHLRQPRRRRARGPRRRNLLPPHRTPLRRPAPVAGPRLHPTGRAHPRRRRRTGHGEQPPAARRNLRRRGRVQRRRPGRAARSARHPGRPRTRQLRREGDPPTARPLHPGPRPRTGSRLEREVVHRDDLVLLAPRLTP